MTIKKECRTQMCSVNKYAFHLLILTLLLTMGFSSLFVIPVLIQMILYTFPIIYVGSHLSLKQSEVDAKTGARPNISGCIGRSDAMLFPVFGSCALVILYLAYKFLDPWYVNLLLSVYLTLIGVAALAETLIILLKPLASINLTQEKFCIFFDFWKACPEIRFNLCWLSIISYLSAFVLGFSWLASKHWTLHNILAVAFCCQAMSLIALGNFKVAALLLSGLFFYDIFWVFGTEVMVSVAKSFDGPIKLIFPVSLDPFKHSIIGLGDIVIPGVFISLCLRFDYHLFCVAKAVKNKDANDTLHAKGSTTSLPVCQKTTDTIDIHSKFSKFYFWVVIIAYELGLITTGVVMLFFQHPQPALLYLVPFCLISTFVAAILNGEVKDLLGYKEDHGPGDAAVLVKPETTETTMDEKSVPADYCSESTVQKRSTVKKIND